MSKSDAQSESCRQKDKDTVDKNKEGFSPGLTIGCIINQTLQQTFTAATGTCTWMNITGKYVICHREKSFEITVQI